MRNGTDIGNPTYIVAQPFSGISEWIDFTSDLPNHRFVISGRIIPEASSVVLASMASLLFLLRRRSYQA